jgi:hypothetical protein
MKVNNIGPQPQTKKNAIAYGNSTDCRASSTLLNNSIFSYAKELLFSFSMIPFLNRNDEKWPHTPQIKIAGRNHILPPLGIENTLIMQS